MESSHYSRQQLIEQATLSKDDLSQVALCRRTYNRLGFAYQIGFARLENRFPAQQPFEINDELLTFVSVQLSMDPSEIHKYTLRQPTISEHQTRIKNYLKLKEFIDADIELVKGFIFEQSCRLEQTSALLSLVEQYLKEQNILQPATSTLRRIIGVQKRETRRYIYEKITSALSQKTQQFLDFLLEVEVNQASLLQHLKLPPLKPSPAALKQLAGKLELISSTGILDVDLSWLNNNYQRTLSNYIKGCSAYRLRELSLLHRYAALTCFLWQTYQDTIDQIVDMYDKLITKVYNWAQENLNEELKQKRRSIRQALEMFTTVGEVILDKDVSDVCVRETLFSKIKKEELAAQHLCQG